MEELLAERGAEVSYETIRRWVARYGLQMANRMRRTRSTPHPQWHLDEMYVSIGGRWMYLWRAIDQEGEALDFLVQSKRDARAALKLMRRLLKRQGIAPKQSLRINGKLIPQRFASWDWQGNTIKLSGRITELKNRTFESKSVSEPCKGLGQLDLLNGFPPFMRLSAITSILDGIWLAPPNIASNAIKRLSCGAI